MSPLAADFPVATRLLAEVKPFLSVAKLIFCAVARHIQRHQYRLIVIHAQVRQHVLIVLVDRNVIALR